MNFHCTYNIFKLFPLNDYFFIVSVMEAGDDITECLEDRTLIIANHQSTGDVPMLMATFNTRRQILPNIMWIMDSVFKYTNFGIVSVIHQDFFIMSVSKIYLMILSLDRI